MAQATAHACLAEGEQLRLHIFGDVARILALDVLLIDLPIDLRIILVFAIAFDFLVVVSQCFPNSQWLPRPLGCVLLLPYFLVCDVLRQAGHQVILGRPISTPNFLL